MKSNTIATTKIAALQEAALSLGGMRTASLSAGLSHGTVSATNRGSMHLNVFGQCLESWGIDPRRLSDWAHGLQHQPAAVARFGRQALALAKRRSEPPCALAVRLAYLRGKLDKQASASPAVIAKLARLDEQRYHDPVAAGAAAMRILEDAPCADTAARALGVWASSWRLQTQRKALVPSNLKRAQVLLWLGMRLAGATDNEWLLGDLLQRAVYVVADRSDDFEHARALGEAAEAIYRELGDRDRQGRALIEQGFALFHHERYEEAQPVYEHALRLIHQESRMYHFAAHHALAAIHTRRGTLLQAAGHAEAAAQHCDMAQAERVHWLRARIAAARGRLSEAARLYEETLVAQGRRDPVACALASSEYTRVLLRGGDLAAARHLCRSMRWLMYPLQDELPEAAEAVRQLNQAAGETETFAQAAAVMARRLEHTIIDRHGNPIARPDSLSHPARQGRTDGRAARLDRRP